MALVKQLKSELDLFKNALGQPKTPTPEVDTLNDVNVVLRAQDIVAKMNQFQTHTGNIMLNNLVMQKKDEWGNLPHRKYECLDEFIRGVKEGGM